MPLARLRKPPVGYNVGLVGGYHNSVVEAFLGGLVAYWGVGCGTEF